MKYEVGDIAAWKNNNTLPKQQKKMANRKPDYLLIVQDLGAQYRVVPCWLINPGYTMTANTTIGPLYISANKLVLFDEANLLIDSGIQLLNRDGTVCRILDKNREIRDKRLKAKQNRKMQRTLKKSKESRTNSKKRRGTHVWAYSDKGEIIEATPYEQWAVKHPYQGGGFSGK